MKMLAGEPAPAIGGQISQIQAQVSALGWLIDDLLVTAMDDSGSEIRLAISAKGNQQVTPSGLPPDFVELAWRHWRDTAGPLKQRKDGLALVKRGAHPVFDPNWQEVKNACSGSDPKLALRRIRNAPKQSAIFDSLRKAAGTPSDATDEETVELIRHLHVLSADFQLSQSELKSGSISQCRQLLSSPSPSEAEELWNDLIGIASKVRMQFGTLTLAELWCEVRKQHQLRDHPDFAQDWQTLADLTSDYKARIQTAFSTGYSVSLPDVKKELGTAIRANLVTIVVGESGTGKSAIVKCTLDDDFRGWTQVWLGPEELRVALSAARRRSLPLNHELGRVLSASSNARNLLILDSAERIDPVEFSIVRQLLEAILPETADAADAVWRVVFVTQNQGWSEASEVISVSRTTDVCALEIKPLKESIVKNTLWATPSLSWLTAHDETVAVLTNLRILAWVAKAGTSLGSCEGGIASHNDVADRLWDYWTNGAADVQSMMMRFAEREAQFERSFALSELNPSEANLFANRPKTLPLRLNVRTNRIEFEHDLAADWARFQYLKQVADNTEKWATLATNPLWMNALRMLGQFLLRQTVSGSTAWDQALREAETSGNILASDVLLDALCLDPDAERFLNERADKLFSDRAKRLDRLLSRFRHIGTVPNARVAGADASLGLYMEAQFRTVIVGRWPSVLRFLIAHRETIESFASVATAKLLETWLNGTPRELSDGTTVPFRKEAAEITLAIARTVQVEKGYGVMYLMDDLSLYTAPLAGAADLTAEISAWALELTGRRQADLIVEQRISDERSAKAKRYAERLKKDAAFKEKEESRKQTSRSILGTSRERLPPWPLGAKRRVDHDFRKAAFKSNGLLPLMRAAPAVAAEVLLALIIEDEPEFEYGRSRYEIDLGLEFASDGYPTMYWKSPFFSFLQVAEREALDALIALVDFCTQRWFEEAGKGHEGSPLGLKLQMNDGTMKLFTGTSEVFGWVHSSSNRNGNLFCALDALERWMILQLDAGVNILPIIDRLLAEGSSSAFIGLLNNIGKYRPELLAGPLAPILTDPRVFYWDYGRVANSANRFDALTWARSGDVVFEMAKNWGLATHRTVQLLSLVVELINSNEEIADFLTKSIPTWHVPTDPKLALEFKIIFAQLDHSNYRTQLNAATDTEAPFFEVPDQLDRELADWNEKHEKPRQYLLVPTICEELLNKQVTLSQVDAIKLYDQLNEIEHAEDIEAEQKFNFRVALAAALIVSGESLLTTNQDARKRTQTIVMEAIAEVGDTVEGIRSARVRYGNEHLKYAAFAVMHLWMKNDSAGERWERHVLTLLTSGDNRVLGTIIEIAYFYRERLGDAWWRLLYAGLLWSALVLLKPQFGEDDDGKLWATWLKRLRRFRLREIAASAENLDVMRIANGYERLDYARQMRAYEAGETRWGGVPKRSWSTGLAWDVLGQLFSWLTNGDGAGDLAEDRLLTGRLWEHEAERQKARGKDETGGEYDLPSQNFGYDLLSKLAELSLSAPENSTRTVWMPVLSHGPAAHYAIGQFTRGLFQQLQNGCDGIAFERVWREIVEYALDSDWHKRERLWYRGENLICDFLGFGHENALGQLPADVLARMHDVYERWAKNHLIHDEDCVSRFCNFLTTPFGAPLRRDGLRWIAAAFKQGSPSTRWFRDRTDDALVELLNTSIYEEDRELATDASARLALVEIAGLLAQRNNPAAMALQERIKLLGH
ncbi:MAG: hypothetical protein R8G34_15065 [Paracoccaceae bacterium]|nr:hypothetical protein [Paracoccaceae bacterium]